MKDAARTIMRHRDGILRWFTSKIANGLIEGINSLVQAAKAKARGYRAIIFGMCGVGGASWPTEDSSRLATTLQFDVIMRCVISRLRISRRLAPIGRRARGHP
jgi:hypothetical protein